MIRLIAIIVVIFAVCALAKCDRNPPNADYFNRVSGRSA